MDRKRPPHAAARGSRNAERAANEKAAIFNRVHEQSRLRDEKRALVSSMGGSPEDVWTPTVENPRLQKKLATPYRDIPHSFEVEPLEYEDELPLPRDDFPSPLTQIENSQYNQEEKRGRKRRCWQCAAAAILFLALGIAGIVMFAARGGEPFNAGAAAAADDDGTGEETPPGCALNMEQLSKCKLYGLHVPACAAKKYKAFRKIYIKHTNPLDADVLTECDATHKAVVALSVAATNYNLKDDAGFYYAMASLYFSMGGDKWKRKKNWLKTPSPCDWYGANCTKSYGFVEINMVSNNLKGDLPTELGLLSTLRSFNVGKNQIQGTVPTEVGLMYSLEELDLFDTLLEGIIPTEIGNCGKLRHANLLDAAFSGSLPTQLGNLGNLENFTMAGNFVVGSLPTEVGNLSNLQTLVLKNFHRLTGTLPSELFQLENLETLDVDALALDSSPFPATIGSMTNLVSLTLRHIGLTGTIPTEIALLHRKLELVLMQFNDMQATLPTELGLLTNMVTLDISHDDIQGTLPSELGLLTKLTTLLFFNNQLIGTVPSHLGSLTQLTNFHVNVNRLTGTLPSEMCAIAIPNIVFDACKRSQHTGTQSSTCIEDCER